MRRLYYIVSVSFYNHLHVSGDFKRLLINVANIFDPDEAGIKVGMIWDPSILHWDITV